MCRQRFSRAFIAGDCDALFSQGIRGVEWNRTYGGDGHDSAWSVRQTNDGGFVVAGDTWSFGAGSIDAWLIKTDSVGDMQWNKTYGGAEVDTAHSVIQTMDGGYALAGSTSSFDDGCWLVKTDPNGNVQWNRTYGGSTFNSVVQTNDDGYAIAGYAYFYGTSLADFFLVKTDASGNELWNKTYGGAENDYAESMIQTSDGGYAIAGCTYSFGAGIADFWLVKTDASGNMKWNKTYGDEWFDSAHSMVQTSDGGYAIAGWTEMGVSGFWLVKTDSAGNTQWSREYGGRTAYCLVQTDDGGYAIVGGDFRFVKTDSAGDMKWSQTFGEGSARCVVQTDDGGYAILGSTSDPDSCDFWLIKYFVPIRVRNFNTGLGYTLIQDAIDAPETIEGHTIKVDADTYYENVVVNKNNLSLIGENPSTTIIDSGGEGNVIEITANNVTISNFTVQHSRSYYGYGGIKLNSASNCKITSNTITDNSNHGVYLDSSSCNIILGNNITDNDNEGIYIGLSNYNSISGNNITNNIGGGVYLWESSSNTISENNIINNSHGVTLACSLSYNNTISQNKIANNYYGIKLDESASSNTISRNNITTNGYLGVSIWIDASSNTVVENNIVNNIVNNTSWGIYMRGNRDNMLKNNTIAGNRYNFDAYGFQDVDASNMVDGKPIYYWINQSDKTVPSDAGYVAVINSTNIKVEGLNLENNGQGVLIAYSSNVTVKNCNLTNNWWGVRLLSSSNVSLYHNNIVDNFCQYETNCANAWDDDYPSGGNYWSDHVCVDLFVGFFQNETGNDGIGDILYIIDADNRDYYPLIKPWTPGSPIAYFDYSPNSPEVDETVTFNASVSYDYEGFIINYTWNFGDGDTTTVADPITTHIYTAGAVYLVNLTIIDNEGLTRNFTRSITVGGDSTPPTTLDDYDGLWHTTDFTVTLTATDDMTGVAETYYRINDGPTKAVSTDGQPLITTEGVNNTLGYWSVDNADNEELPHKILIEIKLDKTYPAIETPSRTPDGDVLPDQSVRVSVNVTDPTSGVKNVTLHYTINDGETWTELPMNHTASNLYEATIPQQEAGTTVRFKIFAYDSAGNNATLDGAEPYCVYEVIPEFPIPIIIYSFMIATLLAVTVYRRRMEAEN